MKLCWIFSLASALLIVAIPVAVAKTYPPIGKVSVLMAQERLRDQSFKSLNARIRATTKEATTILKGWQQNLDESKKQGLVSQYTYETLSRRYENALNEVAERSFKMLKPGGPAAKLKRFKGWVKRGIGDIVAAPIRVITKDRDFAREVGRLVANVAEFKTAAGKAVTQMIAEVEFTEKSVKTTVEEFARLGRVFRANPKLDPVPRAVLERKRCVYACDSVRADCARRNCRMKINKGNKHCQNNCAGCEAKMCEQAFSPAWAAEDRSYVPCSGRYVSRYLAELQNCVNKYIKDKGKNRFLKLADCYKEVNGKFVPERDACREKTCAAKCDGKKFTVTLGLCQCLPVVTALEEEAPQ